MASLIPGFEYDIFISYRQKDNKGERWVSEFVEALKTELESTFKEEISVYFDVNPHDGLLETYDVDASLQRKLKCLVFIPVISRTYCDPKSFAWEREFKAFIEQSTSDQFGLKIRLPNGNVINRILPVRIHELDMADIKLCESVLGGVMRGVEFVYKSSGVNRPLRPIEEHPHDNFNKTYYRDQINKVANSIREIIQALMSAGQPEEIEINKKEKIRETVNHKKISSKKMLAGILLLLFILVSISGIYMYSRILHNQKNKLTLTIIPRTDPPGDAELRSCAAGSLEAITAKLNEIKNLTVKGSFTSFQYLDTKKSISEIRKELNSNYVVEISIRRSSDKTKMWIGLTETKNDNQLWAHLYTWDEKQLLPLFTNVVQTIAGKLNINFSADEIINIEKDLTKNPDAYLAYLMASARLLSLMGSNFLDSTSFRSVIHFYDKAISFDPDFANAFARRAIARSFGVHSGELDSTNIEKCLSDIKNAERLHKDLPEVQVAYGFYYYYCTKEYTNALINFSVASEKDPENYKPLFYMALVYRAMGEWQKSHILLHKVIKFQPQDPLDLTNIGLSFDYMHDYDSAIIYHQKAIEINPKWMAAYENKFESLISKYGNTVEAHSLFDSLILVSPEKFRDTQINLDLYDKKYHEALSKAMESDPSEYSSGGDRLIYLGQISTLINDKINARKYFDSARIVLMQEIKADPKNCHLHGKLGLSYAGLGMQDEAIAEGTKAIKLSISDQNKLNETWMNVTLAQIYTTLGLYDLALDKIKLLLQNPSPLSTGLLKVDPVWDPLHDWKDFKKLIAKTKVD
jgi:tetratricopeptide (TPR) repeat protein